MATVLALAAFAAAAPAPAHAYVDPGAGSIALQVVLGILAGALVAGRRVWDRLVGRRSGRPPRR